jgi:hypothetical protein
MNVIYLNKKRTQEMPQVSCAGVDTQDVAWQISCQPMQKESTP